VLGVMLVVGGVTHKGGIILTSLQIDEKQSMKVEIAVLATNRDEPRYDVENPGDARGPTPSTLYEIAISPRQAWNAS